MPLDTLRCTKSLDLEHGEHASQRDMRSEALQICVSVIPSAQRSGKLASGSKLGSPHFHTIHKNQNHHFIAYTNTWTANF